MDILKLAKQYEELEREIHLISPPIEDPIRGEAGVLFHLSKFEDGLMSGELGKLLRLSSGRVSIILKSLENKELISRNYDTNDKRFTSVKLTGKGKLIAVKNEKNRNDRIVDLIERFGEKDATEYIRLRRRKLEIMKEMQK